MSLFSVFLNLVERTNNVCEKMCLMLFLLYILSRHIHVGKWYTILAEVHCSISSFSVLFPIVLISLIQGIGLKFKQICGLLLLSSKNNIFSMLMAKTLSLTWSFISPDILYSQRSSLTQLEFRSCTLRDLHHR